MEKDDKTLVYYRKEYTNSITGKVEVSFGFYYKEDMYGDVLTEETFFTGYNEEGDRWFYYLSRDCITESEIMEHPEMIITKERYDELLAVLSQTDVLRAEYNKLFEKL